MDLLTIGDVSIDLYMRIDKENDLSKIDEKGNTQICFIHGSKIPVEHFETNVAGNSLNVAFGAKKLGIDTSIYTELGDDANGEEIIEKLEEIGIPTDFCTVNEGKPTNVHSVIVYGGDRTIFSYHEEYSYDLKKWEKPKFIYYTSMGKGYESFQLSLVDYLKENPDIAVGFNPGTLQMKAGLESFRNFLRVTNILFVNKEEAATLVGENPIEKIHLDLHNLGPNLTVITDGKNGVSAFDGENLIKLTAYSDERPLVDKTGAGDAFNAGFVSAILNKKPLKEALAWGVINSGSVIKEVGSINGLCDKEEMEDLVKKLI